MQLRMREIEGDGNCLFRAIVDQLEAKQERHQLYRQLAVDYLRTHAEEFQLFLDEDEDWD